MPRGWHQLIRRQNLITLQQFSEAIDKSTIDRFSDGILAKYKDIKVLPLKSDPRKADSDGDGITDGDLPLDTCKYTNDKLPLKYSYKYYNDLLYPLHTKNPTWEFNFEQTSVKSEEFVDAQYLHNNPTPKAEDFTKYGSNFNPNPYVETNATIISERRKNAVIKDGTFFLATYSGVEHYVLPKTYLDNKSIFAFLDLTIKKDETTLENAKNMLSGTYFDTNPGDLEKFAKYFYEASLSSSIDLSFLIASCLTESAASSKGSASLLCSGYTYNRKKVYNMFGINATDGNGVEMGAKYAYEKEWFSPKDAIVGGAMWIYDRYVSQGQNTLYAQRYNYISYAQSRKLLNQYGSAIDMAFTKGSHMYDKSFDMIKTSNLYFIIPIFE